MHANKQKIAFNQRNLIKNLNLNQQQLLDSTLTPKLMPKQLYLERDKPNFGSLDRKLAEVRKLNFSEMKLRLKQQQQQIEQSLLKKNLIKPKMLDEVKNENGLSAKNENGVNIKNENNDDYISEDCFSNNLINEIANSSIGKPPKPPKHKELVWENKFYKLALNSINQITSESSLNRYQNNNDDHWYLSNASLPSNEQDANNIKNDFLQISQLPLYKNLNHTIARIDNLNENTDLNKTANEASDTIDATIEENEFSNDYDLPPDAYKYKSINSTSLQKSFNNTSMNDEANYFNKNDQLRQSKFIERQIEPLDKCGYLLCNKNKNWKQRYFVLKNNCIFIYKTQGDVKKNKLKGTIRLGKDVNVIRTENSSSFQIVDSKSIIYRLTADSLLTTEEWVRIIKNTLKQLEQKCQTKNIDVEEWVIRRKNGYSKKFWLILKDKRLFFYKSASDEQAAYCLDLNEVRVAESQALDNSRNSLITNDHLLGDCCLKEYVISLDSNVTKGASIYLVLNSKKSFNNWLYHLTICTIENVSHLTDFEKIIYRLMCISVLNNDFTSLDANQLWSDQLMCYSKENLTQPLTNLDSSVAKEEALKLFKSIQLFAMVKINIQSGIEYHVALAQTALDTCFEHPQLQKELLCQLIKQSSLPTANSNGNQFNLVQSFQLLSLAVSAFEPKGKVLWLLKNFLRRQASDETEVGKYAIYCQRTLDRCLTNGCREVKPSRLEVLAILLRNPYQHQQPFSIPVYLSNNNYIVVSFDGLTTIEEFCKQICEQSNIRSISQSGYGLFSDDPIDLGKIHFLPWKCKLGDVISRWEISLKNNNLGKFESKRVIKLLFKKRLFFKSNTKTETDKEKALLVYQLNQDILNFKIPISNQIMLHLTTLLILLENGREDDAAMIRKGIDKFYAKKEDDDLNGLIKEIKQLADRMGNLTKKDCIRIYLNCIKKLPILNGNLFQATISNGKRRVYLTIDEIYFYILDADLKIISNHFLNRFLKFGHKENRLIIHLFNRMNAGSNSSSREANTTTTRSSILQRNESSLNSFANERLEFQMDKDKINEFILLIVDYLNIENSIKFEKLTSESDVTNQTSPFEFSPTSELPSSSLYDLKQYAQLNRSNSFKRSSNSSANQQHACLKEDQEYSEIYSPSYENNDFSSITSPISNSNFMPVSASAQPPIPPIPPLHRCPTWEKNLYELCSTNFNQFVNEQHQQDLFNDLFNDQLANQISTQDLNKIKHYSIGSMISGEYYTNQSNRGLLIKELSNEFSSLDISQYSLSKNSLTKKSSISRCNSDNSSSSFLNEDNLTLKDNLLVLNKKAKWKKRIVLIKNYTIYYFKNDHDLNKNKCKDKFKINSKTTIEEDEKSFKLKNANQIQSISIACDNLIKQKQWITVILSLIEKLNFKNVENLSLIAEGWLSVIKNGICTRKWIVLKDKILLFYLESTDEEANLILNLSENNVEEAESSDCEFVDWTHTLNMERKKEFSISIEPICKESDDELSLNSIYLVFNDKKEFDFWFYHLSIASNKVLDSKCLNQYESKIDKSADKLLLGTQFEQIISRLMKIECEDGLIALESSYLWNEPVICSITEFINQPLTTLKSTTLSNEAIKLYKSIYLFASVEIIKSHAIDYHVALAQGTYMLDYTN